MTQNKHINVGDLLPEFWKVDPKKEGDNYSLELGGLLFLTSARRFTGAEGKWTQLPPILPPSSSANFFGSLFSVLVYLKCLAKCLPLE